ncbi:signal peptidase I [Canibacter zhoujuaniae]|uniref:signal peptidase I n=1 Tax=Canibacter zhoujuaniae TaxID=2708343 RepID=UPI0014209AE0|nr:signal peptidase I [Canibacter zhoujuaniae]
MQNSETSAKKSGGALTFIRDLIVIVLVALLISFLLKTFLIRSFFIPSSSMETTLKVNDRVMVNQLVPDVVGLNRGDVVVFSDPGGWILSVPQKNDSALGKFMQFIGLAPEDDASYLIKRVIGLPGDHVVCCDARGRLSINGETLDETYLSEETRNHPGPYTEFDVTVPENALWVLGDNRFASRDSRFNTDQPGRGFVPIDNVVGRAFVLNWPLDRFTWLDNYAEVFKKVPDPADK